MATCVSPMRLAVSFTAPNVSLNSPLTFGCDLYHDDDYHCYDDDDGDDDNDDNDDDDDDDGDDDDC